MNLGQMLLVMLAVILFSSIVISLYNSMTVQVEMTSNGIFFKQGMFIIDGLIQKYEAQIMGKEITLQNLYDKGVVDTTFTVGEVNYQVIFKTKWCHQDGDTVFVGAPPDFQYLRQDFFMNIVYGESENRLFIGDIKDSDPERFTKVHHAM